MEQKQWLIHQHMKVMLATLVKTIVYPFQKGLTKQGLMTMLTHTDNLNRKKKEQKTCFYLFYDY